LLSGNDFSAYFGRSLAGYELVRDNRRLRDAAHNQHSETRRLGERLDSASCQRGLDCLLVTLQAHTWSHVLSWCCYQGEDRRIGAHIWRIRI
jgi:hypothetical protein